jgi:hypothetical protein
MSFGPIGVSVSEWHPMRNFGVVIPLIAIVAHPAKTVRE